MNRGLLHELSRGYSRSTAPHHSRDDVCMIHILASTHRLACICNQDESASLPPFTALFTINTWLAFNSSVPMCRAVDERRECGGRRRQQPGILHRLLQPPGHFHSGPWLHRSPASLETPRSALVSLPSPHSSPFIPLPDPLTALTRSTYHPYHAHVL